MTFLLLSIASSTGILILFKLMDRFRIGLFRPIVINYLTAFLLGLILSRGRVEEITLNAAAQPWFVPAVLTGTLLIAMFFLIGVSTQKAGITPTTVSTKMSVVIPILFSIFFYGEALGWIKAAGIMTAVIALFFIVKPGEEPSNGPRTHWYLPVTLFLGVGGLDALMKLVQQDYIQGSDPAGFTGMSFFFAFAAGGCICLIRQVSIRSFMEREILGAGIFLGIANFGSIYFLIHALDASVFDSSIVFAVNSIGIVSLSVLSAVLIFRERLTLLNRLGVAMALSAIILFVCA